MTTKNKVKSKIEECIRCFDFIKVHNVMKFLNWEWSSLNDVPSIGDLVIHSQKHLEEALQKLDFDKEHDEYTIGSGGLKVTAYWIDNEVDFELEFILAEWDTFR